MISGWRPNSPQIPLLGRPSPGFLFTYGVVFRSIRLFIPPIHPLSTSFKNAIPRIWALPKFVPFSNTCPSVDRPGFPLRQFMGIPLGTLDFGQMGSNVPRNPLMVAPLYGFAGCGEVPVLQPFPPSPPRCGRAHCDSPRSDGPRSIRGRTRE